MRWITSNLSTPNAAIPVRAMWGAKVFVGKGRCVTCHSGPNFSDDSFHNLGVPQTGAHVPATDDGRFANVPPAARLRCSMSRACSATIRTPIASLD